MKSICFTLSFLLLIFGCPLKAETKLPLPSLSGETLDGKDFQMPKDFKGPFISLVMGFTKSSQIAINRCAELIEKDFPGLSYSMAEIQGAPFFVKGMIKNKIRSSVPESRRSKYLVLSEGKDQLKKLSNFDDKFEDDAYILLLGENTNHELEVIDQLRTQCSAESYPALKTKVQGIVKK